MIRFLFALSIFLAGSGIQAQVNAKNLYFELDSFRLNAENIALLDHTMQETPPGTKVSFRILVHEDTKNKAAVNELDRKRAAELYDYFIAEGISPNNLKTVKTPGREAKGFISDEMKNLLIYELEVFKTGSALDFTAAPEISLPDGPTETFELDAATGKTIQTKGGLKILIPPHALVFKNGLAPTGLVSVQVRAYLHPGEMAAAGLSTELDENALKANYLLCIEGIAAGKPLRLQKGSTITITSQKPEADLANAELYLGQTQSSVFSLQPSATPFPAHAENASLVLVSNRLKWIACAASEKNTGADLTVKLPPNINLVVGLVIEKEDMLCRAHLLPGGKETGFTHLPAGQKAILYAYGIKDGKVYFYSKALQTSAGAKEKILLRESSISEICTFLAGLDKEQTTQ